MTGELAPSFTLTHTLTHKQGHIHPVFRLSRGPHAALPHLNWSLLLCLQTVQFYKVHEGITLIIAVYTGTTEGEREKRALGCSPVWLPVTVKCFSL